MATIPHANAGLRTSPRSHGRIRYPCPCKLGPLIFIGSRAMTVFAALIRSRLSRVVLVCALMCPGTTEVQAQAPAAPAGGTTTVVQGRGLALEWVITIAMCGAALFVVCRSSRRN